MTSNKAANVVGEEASKVEERTSVDKKHNEKVEEKKSDLQKPIDLAYTNISAGENRADKLTTHVENPGNLSLEMPFTTLEFLTL